MAGQFGEVHYEHPTPDELQAASDEIEAIRMLLSEARSRLYWLAHPSDPSQFKSNPDIVGFRSAATESLEDAEGALTPLISFLYPWVAKYKEWADHKREMWPTWVETEGHVITEGWSPENRPGTRRGCITRIPDPNQKPCNKQLIDGRCPDHGERT